MREMRDMDSAHPRGIVEWALVWIRTIARNWVLRARHIGSNIP